MRVGGPQHDEPGDGAQRREVLDGLMRRAVLAERDGVMGEDPRRRQAGQRRQADRAAHVVGELHERRAVGPDDAAVRGHAVDRAAHAVLAHAEEDVAPGFLGREALGVGELGLRGLRQVGGAADHRRRELLEGGHDLGARAAGRDLRLVPVDLASASARPGSALPSQARSHSSASSGLASRQASKRSFHSACCAAPSSFIEAAA